ncbi:hypothetical protein DUI87_05278 [Hirundo rustica rustica]|uniref:Uncharacterized protein n=1 Tax=Hirundo rustica rustica TaxID=333673 RepID=A0A3M0L1E9_HIRRU|nr:hypothetical protein DUI87_05278 [Hirundo rustica rustica]
MSPPAAGCCHVTGFKVENWKQNLRAIYQCFVWSGSAETRKRKENCLILSLYALEENCLIVKGSYYHCPEKALDDKSKLVIVTTVVICTRPIDPFRYEETFAFIGDDFLSEQEDGSAQADEGKNRDMLDKKA